MAVRDDLPNRTDRVSPSDSGIITPGIRQPEGTPVNIGVPQMLHPANVKAHFDEMLVNGPEAAACKMAYNAATATFAKAYEVASVMHQTAQELKQHEVAHGSGMPVLPHDIAVQAGTAMGAAFGRVAPMFDNATNEVQDAIKSMTLRIESKLQDPKRNEAARVAVASEIRDFVRHFPNTFRNEEGNVISKYEWVHGRIVRGDHKIVSAIMTADTGWSMGFDDKQWSSLRTLAEMTFAPNEYATREVLGKLHERLIQGGGWLLQTFDKLVPKVTDQRAKQRDAIKRMENV